jgi:hypothetical protein
LVSGWVVERINQRSGKINPKNGMLEIAKKYNKRT